MPRKRKTVSPNNIYYIYCDENLLLLLYFVVFINFFVLQKRAMTNSSTASSLANLLATSIVVHMATLPVPNETMPRREIGIVSMQRDRILQHAKTHPEMWARNKLLFKRKQKRLVKMRKESGPPPKISDVYNLLNSKPFEDCPWPIPPSVILLHLPIAEIPGVKNAEAILRTMVGDDKVLK